SDALGRHAAKVAVSRAEAAQYAPKTGIGRAYCAASALDTACAVLAMEHGIVPPTPHVTPGLFHGLDLVTGRARQAELRTVLVLSRGLLGANSALLLRRDEPGRP